MPPGMTALAMTPSSAHLRLASSANSTFPVFDRPSENLTWRTAAQQSAYVRLEVRHPLADRSASSGTSVSTTPTIDPMAALANPVWLGR